MNRVVQIWETGFDKALKNWLFCLAVWAIVLIAVTWMPALAEVPCMPNEQALSEVMGERYQETPLPFEFQMPNQSGGAGTAMRMFANPKTGTWTVLVFPPNGMVCLIMAGDHWRFMNKEDDPIKPNKNGKPT